MSVVDAVPRRAWQLRLLDRAGAGLLRRGVPRLEIEAVLAGARGRTGLDDFGDEAFRGPLERLLAAFAADSTVAFSGRLLLRERVVLRLAERLKREAWLARRPEVASATPPPALVITGMPRTGTTLLYSLLANDGRLQAPELWEMLRPLPGPPASTRWRRTVTALGAWGIQELTPRMRLVHPLRATGPEEDTFLLMRTFATSAHILEADVGGYLSWLHGPGRGALERAYTDYRRELLFLGGLRSRRHWLLKSPIHLGGVAALAAALPAARLVVLRRDPVAAIASACSLVATTRSPTCARQDPRRLGHTVLGTFAAAAETGAAELRALPASRVLPLAYDDLVAAPLAAVAEVYRWLGLDLAPTVRDRMAAWLAADTARRRRRHRYSLESYGLDAATVRERFAGVGQPVV